MRATNTAGLSWLTVLDINILFNNGENPKSLPQIELDGQLLNYKQNTKFLGI